MNATTLITINDATDFLPRKRGKKVHVKTVTRWIVNGCRGVHLAGTKVGSTWYTTKAWLLEFARECSKRTEGTTPDGAASASQQLARRMLEERYGFYGDKEETDALPDMPKPR